MGKLAVSCVDPTARPATPATKRCDHPGRCAQPPGPDRVRYPAVVQRYSAMPTCGASALLAFHRGGASALATAATSA